MRRQLEGGRFQRVLKIGMQNSTPLMVAAGEMERWSLLGWPGPFTYIGQSTLIDPDGEWLPHSLAVNGILMDYQRRSRLPYQIETRNVQVYKRDAPVNPHYPLFSIDEDRPSLHATVPVVVTRMGDVMAQLVEPARYESLELLRTQSRQLGGVSLVPSGR